MALRWDFRGQTLYFLKKRAYIGLLWALWWWGWWILQWYEKSSICYRGTWTAERVEAMLKSQTPYQTSSQVRRSNLYDYGLVPRTFRNCEQSPSSYISSFKASQSSVSALRKLIENLPTLSYLILLYQLYQYQKVVQWRVLCELLGERYLPQCFLRSYCNRSKLNLNHRGEHLFTKAT